MIKLEISSSVPDVTNFSLELGDDDEKQLAYSNNGNICNGNLSKCYHVQNIINSLNVYHKWILSKHKTIDIMNKINISNLSDSFYHLKIIHDDILDP